MEIRFSPELETKFREQVAKGLAQLDRGEFIEHDEVVARIERLFHS